MHRKIETPFSPTMILMVLPYYPESLMISHNPHPVVFYKNTKLFNLFVDLRAPDMGTKFTINNTCVEDASKFSNQLLEQIYNSQRAM